jgi:hypothetical protein
MTEKELLDLARTNLGEANIDNVKDAVLAFHGHGGADATTGEVEAPTGHVIRVDRWIVVTDSEGFSELEEYESADQALVAFADYDDEYSEWAEGRDD